ncbi:transcription antiterminator BglG [Vagococcus lutrae]|uniref:BglG family transcription antiterminator n=1 Tax=Vagococcus lutrae TaxID=81947 RepID=UPI0019292EE9|nr:PRD domain-containing protein [Vagococcus lutrae]GEQ61355.1 transcription antiterminator BglG [Vagococcus lutrae]GEQ63390.1 transcription antiterminator BglG [Vagococcus lutrae]GEQ65251.1 transcription antiterminator BglG [Vagococcus lutrae]
MSLTNKWYEILNILLVKCRVTVEELMTLTDLSKQTLRKNIQLLNDRLQETAQIVEEDKYFELKVAHLDRFQLIMSGKLKKETDFNSAGKRMAYIIRALIDAPDYILIDDLCDELQVSRGTVNKDMREIKKAIGPYGVKIVGIPNKGMQIVGDEFHFRLVVLKFVYDYYSDDYPLTHDTLQWADKLAKYYKLDQVTLALLKKVIGVSVHRILKTNPMTQPIAYYKNFEYQTPILEDFMIFVEKEYRLTLGRYDQDFLSFPVNTRTTAMVSDASMKQHEADVREIFDEMMLEIQNNFMTKIDEEALFEAMKYHLMFMLNRIIFHIDVYDLFMDEIQLKYPFSFELAKVAMKAVEDDLMVTVHEVEISYLAIYFELIMQKKKGRSQDKKVAIVCSTGRGTATLIHRQLREVLGADVEIVQYSETDYLEIDSAEYLAIFSTLPLESRNGKPVIQITNLFDNELLIKEWRKLDEQRLLTKDIVDFSFVILDSQKSYLENVATMIEEWIEIGKLAPEFMPLWQERERRQTTIFDQGIGFPHTINKGSNEIVFRIGVFPEKIHEGKQYVKIVFLVGIPEYINDEIEKTLMAIYDLIFSIGQKKEYVAQISQCQSREDVLAFLMREELS